MPNASCRTRERVASCVLRAGPILWYLLGGGDLEEASGSSLELASGSLWCVFDQNHAIRTTLNRAMLYKFFDRYEYEIAEVKRGSGSYGKYLMYKNCGDPLPQDSRYIVV